MQPNIINKIDFYSSVLTTRRVQNLPSLRTREYAPETRLKPECPLSNTNRKFNPAPAENRKTFELPNFNFQSHLLPSSEWMPAQVNVNGGLNETTHMYAPKANRTTRGFLMNGFYREGEVMYIKASFSPNFG